MPLLGQIPSPLLDVDSSGTATSHGHLQGLGSFWAKSRGASALCAAMVNRLEIAFRLVVKTEGSAPHTLAKTMINVVIVIVTGWK